MLAGRAGYCLMVFGVVRSIFGYKALNANAVFGQRNRKGGMSLRSMLGKRTKGECRGHRADSTARHRQPVGGWGCRGLPNNDRLKRSAITLHCPNQPLIDTLV
jgi:hypothetical protein